VLRELIALGHRGVPEAAREVIAEQRAIGGEGVYDRDPALFIHLMLERCLAALDDAVSSECPVFFDRGSPRHRWTDLHHRRG
jgi:predicted ATPase